MKKSNQKTEARIKLLQTGLRLFAENGYNGTGIKEIVDEVGIPKGSFYNYFKSKEDFTVEIIQYYSDTLSVLWADIFALGPQEPLAALRNSFEMILSHHEQSEVRTGCLVGNLAAEISEASDLCRQKMHHATITWKNRVAGYIRQGQRMGTIRDDIPSDGLTDFIWNAWEGALLNMKIVKSTAPVKECIRLLFDFFLKP
ncbi:MAG: TetR/AcrR family transcriptional regulator [Proteobacteria bacterium]|nr:TetR/AcrR family transcriptional regulator [Pseudomonadota bacterium]MBU1060190.1 TetR/AcrR family transcriptional regulator [Pseudomonadota bacterium]